MTFDYFRHVEGRLAQGPRYTILSLSSFNDSGGTAKRALDGDRPVLRGRVVVGFVPLVGSAGSVADLGAMADKMTNAKPGIIEQLLRRADRELAGVVWGA